MPIRYTGQKNFRFPTFLIKSWHITWRYIGLTVIVEKLCMLVLFYNYILQTKLNVRFMTSLKV